MSKVQSGTFRVIYELLNADLKHMKLAPMMKSLKNSSLFTISDLRPRLESMKSYHAQTVVNIVKILTKYVKGLGHFEKHLKFQNQPR